MNEVNYEFEIVTDEDHHLKVFGYRDYPKFVIESIEMDGLDMTESLRGTPIWDQVVRKSEEKAAEVDQEHSDYLADLKREQDGE